MNPSIRVESLDWLYQFWQQNPGALPWEPLFMLPPWLKTWHETFAPDEKASVLVASQGDTVIGIAPLIIDGCAATLMGSPDVCDYVDFIAAPGKEADFGAALAAYLPSQGVTSLHTGVIRPDARVVPVLTQLGKTLPVHAECERDEVTLEKDLPPTWDEYLQSLDSKQRHEVRRKLRRLEEAGSITYRFVTAPADIPAFMETFLKLFSESREDKATFLTPAREQFFRALPAAMAEAGLFRGGVMELDGAVVAALLAFDYNGTVYLYNSGYDINRSNLSVGVLSKALFIKDSIERGKKRFDFLKGAERYKYHLGGKEIQLHRCCVSLGEKVA